MISGQTRRVCAEGKPVSTLPDHAVDAGCQLVAKATDRRSDAPGQIIKANVPDTHGRTSVISARKISMLAAFAAAALSSPPALAQISDDVVKIGVLTDMNGPASTPTGQGSVTAAQVGGDGL